MRSVTVRSGPLLEAARAMLGSHITHVTVNRDVCCSPHTDTNGGPSYISFFGNYKGGELCVGVYPRARLTLGGPGERGVWIGFDGRCEHWNLPHEGHKLSVVAYPKPSGGHARMSRAGGSGTILARCGHRFSGCPPFEEWDCASAVTLPPACPGCVLALQTCASASTGFGTRAGAPVVAPSPG